MELISLLEGDSRLKIPITIRSDAGLLAQIDCLVLLVVSICFINGLFDTFIMNIWDESTQSFEIMLFYFSFSVFGIVLALLSIPYERIAFISDQFIQKLRPILAFILPIIMISFFENSAIRLVGFLSALLPAPAGFPSFVRFVGFPSVNYDAHTLSLHAFDHMFIRLQAGSASAIFVINIIVIFALITVAVAIGLLVYKIMGKKCELVSVK